MRSVEARLRTPRGQLTAIVLGLLAAAMCATGVAFARPWFERMSAPPGWPDELAASPSKAPAAGGAEGGAVGSAARNALGGPARDPCAALAPGSSTLRHAKRVLHAGTAEDRVRVVSLAARCGRDGAALLAWWDTRRARSPSEPR